MKKQNEIIIIWATQRLKEYIVKGFALDDERLKQGGQKARYFQELLQRIRDIRSSERNFYQKVTDIYATSVNYRKDDKLTRTFLVVANSLAKKIRARLFTCRILCAAAK